MTWNSLGGHLEALEVPEPPHQAMMRLPSSQSSRRRWAEGKRSPGSENSKGQE
jgi:hypothetical protein